MSKHNPRTGRLAFTVNLDSLLAEGARLLLMSDQAQAGVGLVMGYELALGYLLQIATVAERLADPQLLLLLFALGVVENPVEFCQEKGTWDDTDEALVEMAGAFGAL